MFYVLLMLKTCRASPGGGYPAALLWLEALCSSLQRITVLLLH